MDRTALSALATPIHREGYRYIVGGVIATLVGFALWDPLGWLGVIGCAALAFFFRDPDRVTPTRAGLVVAPADGMVLDVGAAIPPEELEMGEDPLTRVVIYVSLVDVHLNRAPASGTVAAVAHRPGLAAAPWIDRGEDNERNSIRLRMDGGRDIGVVQIAGRLTRGIVCWVKAGDQVLAGQRVGMIRFGSRVDVYLNGKLKPLVAIGQRTIAGETVIADVKSREAARMGEKR